MGERNVHCDPTPGWGESYKGKMSLQEKFSALHTEEAFNDLSDFSAASKAPSGELFLQSEKQRKITWCEIGTAWRMVYASCDMVLRWRHRVWSLIVLQQQNTRFEKPWQLFPNRLFQFRQGVTVPRSIDGPNLQTVHAKSEPVLENKVCAAETHIPTPGSLLPLTKFPDAVDAASSLGHVVPMFCAFLPCPLLPNVWRSSVVIQRIRLKAVVPLMLIGPQFSTVNGPHHTVLNGPLQSYDQYPYHLRKQSTNCPLIHSTRTPCFVNVGHCCSIRMSQLELVLNYDTQLALSHHALKCFQCSD
ncbi:hypothetical protein TNCV_575381 [Trichonephila clavipes]|nr:hypothetical protein TNCV_575381 [Trichonephila clavipes]